MTYLHNDATFLDLMAKACAEYKAKTDDIAPVMVILDAQRIIDDDPTCQKNESQLLWQRLAELRKTKINWSAIS